MYESRLPSGDQDARAPDCRGSLMRNVWPSKSVAQSPSQSSATKVSSGGFAYRAALTLVEPAAATTRSVATASRSALMAHRA